MSSSDAEWKTAVAALMHHARLIVMLPSARPGTLWELEQLVTKNWIAKTVFIDAPNTSATGYRQEVEWGEIGRFLASHGYKLPHDDPKGRVIAFGGSNTPRLAEPLNFVGPQMLHDALVRALALSQPSRAAHDGLLRRAFLSFVNLKQSERNFGADATPRNLFLTL